MSDSVVHVTVKPKSSRNQALLSREGVLIRVTAAPVDGAANAAVIGALAKAIGVPKSCVQVTAGATARVKRITVRGLPQEQLDERLRRLPTG